MSKNKIIKVIYCLFCQIFLMKCTFGSVGNSNEEQLKTLQNLLILRDGITTGLNTSLQVFDNQGDDDISRIEFTSAGNTYSISVASDSYIQWDSGYYRINPNEKVLGVFDVKSNDNLNALNEDGAGTRTHTPFTVPLDLPATDIYGRNYVFLNSGTETNITKNNSTNETGASFTSSFTKRIPDSPTGVISLATIGWEAIYLNVDITRSGITKSVKILMSRDSISLKPKCKLKVDTSRTKPINIGIQYSNLFRDYAENGTSVSFLQNLFLKSGSDFIIASISNTDLLINLSKNMKTEDLVFSFPSCTPGVER